MIPDSNEAMPRASLPSRFCRTTLPFVASTRCSAGVAAGTRFAVIPGHQRVHFNPESLRRLDRLEAIAARTGLSQTQLAVAWALHQPEVATVLIGGRSPTQMEQAFAAQSHNDPGLWHELDCA